MKEPGEGQRSPASETSGEPVPRGLLDVAAWLTCAALAVFVVAMALAIALYPGGSWTLPGGEGFSLARNFWCDVLRSRAINGMDNAAGKQLGSVAFGALGLGMWPYWWVAGAVFTGRRRLFVVGFGAVSAAALAGMVLVPSDVYPLTHGIVALTGAVFGMAAAVTSVAARSAGEPRFGLRRVSGLLTVVLALVNAALYVYVAYLHGPETPVQPSVQKLATLALLTWMLSSVRRARQRA